MLQGLELSEKMHVVMIGILPLFHCILIPFCSIYSSFGWLFLYSYFHFYFLLVLPELCGHLRGIQHQGGPPGPPMNFSGPLHPHGLPLGPLPTFANQPFQGQNVPPTGCQLGPMGPMGPTCLGPINSPGQLGPNQGIQQGHWKLVQWTSSSSTCIWTTSRLPARTFNVGTTKSIWRQPQVNPPTTQTQWSGPQQDQGQGAPWNPTMGQPQAVPLLQPPPQQVPQWAESTSSNFLDTFMWTTSCTSFPTHPA